MTNTEMAKRRENVIPFVPALTTLGNKNSRDVRIPLHGYNFQTGEDVPYYKCNNTEEDNNWHEITRNFVGELSEISVDVGVGVGIEVGVVSVVIIAVVSVE